MASGKSAKSLKSVQKLRSSDRQSSQRNFAKIEVANPSKREQTDVKKISERFDFFLPDFELRAKSYGRCKKRLQIRVSVKHKISRMKSVGGICR